jgi:SAM-dependent methyltransferase
MRTQEAVVDAQFGPRASSYATSSVHSSGEDLEVLKQIIGERPGAVALDLGCGGGHAAYVLAPRVARVIAYDLSQAMIDVTRREARRRGLDNLDVHQGVAERLPFDDATFDIIVSRYSVHHWHHAEAGLHEARRVLKAGGLAVFMDIATPGSPLLDTWLQSIELLRDPSHVRNYSVAEWQRMQAAAGFRHIMTRCHRVRLEFQPWIERMNTPAPQVTAIRALQSVAPEDVLRYFEVEGDGTFSVDSMLMQMEG